MKNPSALQTLLTQAYESEKNLRHFNKLASQEMNTLLATLLGELETAKEVRNKAEWHQQIQAAEQVAHRVLFWIRNIHYFTSGISPQMELVDFSNLVFKALEKFEGEYQRFKIEVEAKIEDSIFCLVDPYAIEQALLNLLAFPLQSGHSARKVNLSLRTLPSGIRLNFELFTPAQDALMTPPTQFRPLALENLTSEVAPLLGLQVCHSIFEAHSGKFSCLQAAAEEIELILELPLDARLNKPHLHQEKRRFPRVAVNLPGRLMSQTLPSFPVRVTVLSTGGAFVAASQKCIDSIKVDDRIALTLLPETSSPIEITEARVANIRLYGEQSGLGLEFVQFNEKAKNLLAALVKAHAS